MHLSQGLNIGLRVVVYFTFSFFPLKLSFIKQFGVPFKALVPDSMLVKSRKSTPPAKS